MKLAYLSSIVWIDKTLGLHHIHVLGQISIKESCFDIHLPYFIIEICSNNYNNPNRFKHRYGRESLVVVNSLNLSKTFCDKSNFIDVNISIYIFLLLIDPFTLDGSHTIRQVYQVPNLIFLHGFYFGFHGILPSLGVRVCHRLCICCRLIIV